jgi:hypothetical protein
MPRGRHRHSPPLHKLLPPTSVAAVAVVCAGSVWFFADPVVLRSIAAVAGIAAAAGAVFMRSWDREAGHRVADLIRARESDQWKTDERVAELEADVDESREIRGKLDSRLRAKRVELARLRGEHAALLRRYATAETERASALEGRRRLAIEAAVEPKALSAGSAPTPSAYLVANRALDDLAGNWRRQSQGVARQEQARRNEPVRQEQPRQEPLLPEVSAEVDEAPRQPAEARPALEEAAVRPSLPARRAAAPSAIVPYARRQQHRPEPGRGAGFDFFGTQAAHSGHGPVAGQGGPGDQSDQSDQSDQGLKDAAHGRTGELEQDEHARQAREEADPEQPQGHTELPAAMVVVDSEESGEFGDSEERGDSSRLGDSGELGDSGLLGDSGELGDYDQEAGGAEAGGAEGEREWSEEREAAGQIIDLTEHDDTEPLELGGLRSAIGS